MRWRARHAIEGGHPRLKGEMMNAAFTFGAVKVDSVEQRERE